MDVSPPVNALLDTSSSEALELHLRGVSYTYPQSEKVALSNLSYTFRPGTTAIVGPNGAGKSTLVNGGSPRTVLALNPPALSCPTRSR